MSYSPTLGRWMETDPAGYVDGPNLYGFEGSGPVSAVDPTGLIKIKTSNADVAHAYHLVQQTRLGSQLIKEIKDLEEKVCKEVEVDMVRSRVTPSFTVGIHVYINPLMQLGYDPISKTDLMSYSFGPNASQIVIGVPLDSNVYHELTHAKRALERLETKLAAGEEPYSGDLLNADQVGEEERQVTGEETEYMKERGYRPRFSYDLTQEQQIEKTKLEKGGTLGPNLIDPAPSFQDDETRRKRGVPQPWDPFPRTAPASLPTSRP